ncbi:hypothetical protein AVEN_114434-1, partial [Araneus ventricosus]
MKKRGEKDVKVFVDTDEGKIQEGLEPEVKWSVKDVQPPALWSPC